MELNNLTGTIIGIISDDFVKDNFENKKVKEIIVKKVNDSLKMVKLSPDILEETFQDLSIGDKNKVILASKLHDKEIVLVNFSQGLTQKEVNYFKILFKKISTYNRRIFLVDKKTNLFLNCVDRIYVINDGKIKYETVDIFDKILELYVDLPKIVEFSFKCEKVGVILDHYKELDELLKAIYRIKA